MALMLTVLQLSEPLHSLFHALEPVGSQVTKSSFLSHRHSNMRRYNKRLVLVVSSLTMQPIIMFCIQFLEVVRLGGHAYSPEDMGLSRDMYLLQLCSGVDENVVGGCAQLVFAPIDESFADDAPLLPSGFRVIPLDHKTSPVILRRHLICPLYSPIDSTLNLSFFWFLNRVIIYL